MGVADAFKNEPEDAGVGVTPEEAPISDELKSLVHEMAALDAKIRELAEEKRALAEKIQPDMEHFDLKAIEDPDTGGTITLKQVGDRRASKKAIVGQFGEAGKAFWDALPNQKRSYITVDWPKT